MPACELYILFNKEDRCYYPNEPVSGRVVVKANKDFSGRDFHLAYGWRTHGWGNKDEGDKEFISLASNNLSFRNGEIREFTFRFHNQCEPLTYHGRYVNVDWYLKAELNTQEFLRPAIHAEEDFLLIDRNIPIGLLPAPKETPKKPKIDPLILWFWGPAGALMLIILMLSGFMSTPVKVLLSVSTIFALIVAWIFQRRIFNFLLQRIIGIKEAQVSPETYHPGDQANCHLLFQAINSIHLDYIAAVVQATERSTSGAGTRQQSKEYVQYFQQTLKSYGEELAAGQLITFDCFIPIPANGPPTFIATNNSIDWSIALKIACKHLPSWEKVFPIIVVGRKGQA